ncbi:PXM16, partial [Symbiodinium sp. KB8]
MFHAIWRQVTCHEVVSSSVHNAEFRLTPSLPCDEDTEDEDCRGIRFVALLRKAESPSPRYLPRVLAGITEFNHLTPGSQLYQITAAPGSGFDIWLAERGGFSNAYTAEEQTVYYVALNEEDFEALLDRYSDVFRAPLFEASWIWDEVSAVNSEHNKNRNSQDWRLQELIHHHADERSPMHRFHTGNRATLQRTSKETLAAEIQAFFAANYCPPRFHHLSRGRDKPKPDQQVLDPSADDQLHFYRKALRRVLPPIPGNAMASVLPSTPLSCAYQSAAVEPKDEAP